jgi:hypothetical protein
MFDFYLKHNRKRKARKLEDILVDEISLVDKTANRHTFAIVKAAEKSLDEALKEFMGLVKDEEADIVDKAGAGDTKKAMEAVKEAIKTLTPYMDVLADDARQAVKLLAGVAGGAAASYGQGGGDHGYPAKDQPDEKAKVETKGGDELHFYKGSTTQLDCWLSGMLATAKENKRRSDPRHDDGFVFKADDSDDEPDEAIDDDEGDSKGVSKALKGQDGDEEGDEPVDNFPSFNFPVFPRDRVVRGKVL